MLGRSERMRWERQRRVKVLREERVVIPRYDIQQGVHWCQTYFSITYGASSSR